MGNMSDLDVVADFALRGRLQAEAQSKSDLCFNEIDM
jgi:hypothetical protein